MLASRYEQVSGKRGPVGLVLLTAIVALLLTLRVASAGVSNATSVVMKRMLFAARDSASIPDRTGELQQLFRLAPGTANGDALARSALVAGDYELAARSWHVSVAQPDQLPLVVVQHALQ